MLDVQDLTPSERLAWMALHLRDHPETPARIGSMLGLCPRQTRRYLRRLREVAAVTDDCGRLRITGPL